MRAHAHRDLFTLKLMSCSLSAINRTSACDILVPLIPTCVQAPDCSLVGPGEKILLFRHQPTSEQLLLRLRAGSQLQDGDLIEVVIAGR